MQAYCSAVGGFGRVLALRGVKGLGEEVVGLGACGHPPVMEFGNYIKGRNGGGKGRRDDFLMFFWVFFLQVCAKMPIFAKQEQSISLF